MIEIRVKSVIFHLIARLLELDPDFSNDGQMIQRLKLFDAHALRAATTR
jgi:hypothetical protein